MAREMKFIESIVNVLHSIEIIPKKKLNIITFIILSQDLKSSL